MGDEDYEHWPEASKPWAEPAVPAAGYDSHNGLHTHSYLAAKDPSPEAPVPKPATEAASSEDAPQPVYYTPQSAAYAAPPQYYAVPQPTPPHMQQQIYGGYGGFPGYQHPGYYAYPHQAAAPYGPVIAVAPPSAPQSVKHMEEEAKPAEPEPEPEPEPAPVRTNTHFYVPRFTGVAEAPGLPRPSAWLGRTVAQVEEDNMKIAQTEGAWAARKMEPTGVSNESMCWVIELDQTKTLRTFIDIKALKGSWKRDPRYEDAYYFVREEEEDEKCNKN